ncbi:putative N-acetyltransferase 8B [Centropristis striata]|uniref:putative N-acetyltransferase 8B n=1 Tax=Centropristis striata TaxID=184440 RepID=UPI0027DF5680|nr:putative N-acetyltransferase 8B [Centropristis striata]
MQPVIRPYRPSDKDTVRALFTFSAHDQFRLSFNKAITSPLYLAITLALCVAGYLLGSVLGAVVLPGAWVGLVYSCCHETYVYYLRESLRTDMQDIAGNYMRTADECFWVAEAEVEGRAQIVGMVAVMAKQSGKERYGELFRMVISPSCRRMGLGSKLAKTVINFCKERGFSKVVLDTTSPLAPAVALYKKLGFSHVNSHTETVAPVWVVKLSRVTLLYMEKHL